MKALILAGLTVSLSILWLPAYTQTDSVYCLPISKARLLVADALKLQLSEALNATLTEQVRLVEERESASYASFTNLLKIEREKYQVQKETTQHMENLSNSWRDQATYYQKKVRKQNWQKAGLALIVVVESLLLLLL